MLEEEEEELSSYLNFLCSSSSFFKLFITCRLSVDGDFLFVVLLFSTLLVTESTLALAIALALALAIALALALAASTASSLTAILGSAII